MLTDFGPISTFSLLRRRTKVASGFGQAFNHLLVLTTRCPMEIFKFHIETSIANELFR